MWPFPINKYYNEQNFPIHNHDRTWWRHQMNTFSALLALCAGNRPVTGEFPSQRPVTRNFDVYFDLRLNKGLSKQSWGWWFETPSRQYDVTVMDKWWSHRTIWEPFIIHYPRVGNYATAWMDSWRVTQQILYDFRNKFLTSSHRNSIIACFDTRRSLHM